jgi:multidrug efflux pump subunit AcrA (membrane-fusion protein)
MSEFMMVLQDAAKPGSLAKKGDPVAEFDRQYMLTRLDDYKSSIVQTEANFKRLQADLDLSKQLHNQTIRSAQGAFEKAELDLKTLPVLSDMDAERRKLAREEAKARFDQMKKEVQYVDEGIRADRRVAELEVRQSRLELRRAENNVNRLVMKAPIDGLVVMQNIFRGSDFDQIKVGDQISPGQMFMQIVDPSSMIVSALVNQLDVEKLRIGQKARMRFDAFPGLELPGHIYAIGSVGKSSRSRPDWVKEMTVVLKLDKMDPRVIPDLSVSADVILNSEESPAIAPREAVFKEAGTEGQAPAYGVFIRSAEGLWEKRQVEVGLESNTFIAIKSGLKPGEVIAMDRPPEPGAQSPPPAKS